MHTCELIDFFVCTTPGTWEEFRMPFTAHDLRYRAEETYPALYAHLSRHAQRSLDTLKFDPVELDMVVGHVVEQLVRLGLLGGEDNTPLTVLDRLTEAQFYAFLNRSIRNKAIDRLRKRRLPMSYPVEGEGTEGTEAEDDFLNEATEPVGGSPPFSTPEQIALAAASQEELRNILKHCIKALNPAPKQFAAIIQELREFDAFALLKSLVEELPDKETVFAAETTIANVSQHKDHAHKKLRHCLQERSSNLTVTVALRLTEYGVRSAHSHEFLVDIQTLAQDDLSEDDVRIGLNELEAEGLLDVRANDVVHFTSAQLKHLLRFYKVE
jgi:DNA-directed RNA polymerase specialized sigma24 family protein